MKVIGGIVAAALAAAALVVAGGGGTARGAGRRASRSFTIGTAQDIDSMNPTVGVHGRRVRGLEHAVRDAHRQGREGLLGHARARRVLGGLGGRQDVDLQAARRT